MVKKNLLIGVVVLLVTGVVAYNALFHKKKTPVPPGSSAETPAEGLDGFVKNRAEDTFKKAYYTSLISTYEKMLTQFSDSPDLKKKLATAYLDTKQYARAKPLLEEVLRSSPEDAQAKKLLEEIPK